MTTWFGYMLCDPGSAVWKQIAKPATWNIISAPPGSVTCPHFIVKYKALPLAFTGWQDAAACDQKTSESSARGKLPFDVLVHEVR